MYKNTLTNPLRFRKDAAISAQGKDFIAGLLVKDPRARLGSSADALEVMNHPWFAELDWSALAAQKLTPVFKPLEASRDWISNFDPSFTREKASDSFVQTQGSTLHTHEKDF